MNNWRSDIGKNGYWLACALMKHVPTQEGRKAFILDELDDLHYIYKYPERRVSASYSRSQMRNLTPIKSSRGAFRSAHISRVYSQHLRKISSVTNRYGHQIGALALAAAAVCQSMVYL